MEMVECNWWGMQHDFAHNVVLILAGSTRSWYHIVWDRILECMAYKESVKKRNFDEVQPKNSKLPAPEKPALLSKKQTEEGLLHAKVEDCSRGVLVRSILEIDYLCSG